MIFRVFSAVILVFIATFLSGCDNEEERKEWQVKIQNNMDAGNPNGNEGVCLLVNVDSFPYITEYYPDNGQIEWPDLKRKVQKSIVLNQSLEHFSDLGLLIKTPILNDAHRYQYTLTPEGEQYYRKRGFCFGRKVVEEIYQLRLSKQNPVAEFTYSIENLPQWATDLRLNSQIYNIKVRFMEGRLYQERLYLDSLEPERTLSNYNLKNRIE